MLAHLTRNGMKKPLHSMTRVLKFAKNHEKWTAHFAPVINERVRYRRGRPPIHATQHTGLRAELMNCMLLDEQQKTIGQGQRRVGEIGRKEYHLKCILQMLSYDLCGPLLWHYCDGCCSGRDEAVTKLAYHFAPQLFQTALLFFFLSCGWIGCSRGRPVGPQAESQGTSWSSPRESPHAKTSRAS